MTDEHTMTSRHNPRQRRTSALLAATAFVFACALAVPAVAQPGPPGPGHDPEQPERSPEEMRSHVRDRIRIMRAWRLTEVLDLDELTAVQLFEHLESYDALIMPESETLRQLSDELRGHLGAGTGTDDEIDRISVEIMAAHRRIEELNVERVQNAAFLTARQRATLMFFLPEFDNEIRQLSRRVRGDRGERRDRGERGHRRRSRRSRTSDTPDETGGESLLGDPHPLHPDDPPTDGESTPGFFVPRDP